MNVLFSLFVLIVANYLQINDISNNYKGVWDILFSLLFTNFAKSKKGEIMEKENIMTVDIEDFKKSQHILDYIDDDFAIVNSLDGIPYSNDTVRLNCFLIAVCAEGCIQLDINYRTYQLQAGNPYKPMLATVVETIQETGNIKTLRVVLDDPEQMANFTYEPGQVGQLSVFGAGESTFVINTPPSQKEYLQFSVMQAGEVTSAIHRLSPGDKVGVRAPLGNFFPYNDWKGKNIFFVGGGIGMAPIRTIMLHVLEHKADYGKVSLLYGARSPRDMAFSYELDGWLANPDLDCTLCIDNPYEGWPHKVGLIPNVLTELNPSPDNCVAVLCGPPIMIKFTLQALEKLGFQPENIVTTLEKRMKCGIGICGRCNIGSHYVCVDGPVFTMAQLKELPPEL